jgi:tetratricopeptide (TPR) repeat protein
MNRCVVFLYCLLLALPTVAQKSKGSTYFEQAKEALNQGDTQKALTLMNNSRSEYLKEKNYYRFFVATQSMIIIYQDGGQYAEAEKVISEAIPLIPPNNNDNLVLQAKLQDNLAYGYLYGMNRPELDSSKRNSCNFLRFFYSHWDSFTNAFKNRLLPDYFLRS